MKQLFSKSCSGVFAGCLALVLVALCIGAVVIGNFVGQPPTTVPATLAIQTNGATSTHASQPLVNGNAVQQPNTQVILEGQNTAIPTSLSSVKSDSSVVIETEVIPPSPTITPTPNLANLSDQSMSTLTYPLTVTAQANHQATKVSNYLSNVYATRTAAAERVIPTHTALTHTAQARN